MTESDNDGRPVRLLIVEDDPIFRESLLILFEQYPTEWSCTIASSIKEAEENLATKNYDMAILDIHLPDGDASDLIRVVGTLPCILFTQDSEEPTFKKMVDDPTVSQNIVGYLIKPLQQGVILSIRASWRIIKERQLRNRLVAEATAGVEEERRLIAKELHDSLGASLTQLSWIFSGIAKEITQSSNDPALAEKIKAMCDHGRKVVSTAHADASQAVTKLRPEVVNVAGLGMAIDYLLDQWQVTAPNVEFDYDCTAQLSKIDLRRAGIIYRILQEGLTNAMRHTAPEKIKVTITLKDNRLLLKILSKGPILVETDTFKLTVLRERTSSLGGDLQFTYDAASEESCLTIGIPS